MIKKITISTGIANLELGDDLRLVIKRADSGLYLAKEGGRNKIEYSEIEII